MSRPTCWPSCRLEEIVWKRSDKSASSLSQAKHRKKLTASNEQSCGLCQHIFLVQSGPSFSIFGHNHILQNVLRRGVDALLLYQVLAFPYDPSNKGPDKVDGLGKGKPFPMLVRKRQNNVPNNGVEN